jgi:integrase
MSAVFSWGYENGKVKMNPCVGVRKFPEPHRERYIWDWEYYPVLDEAEIKWPLLYAAMEISYLCAARQGDVWNLEKPDIRKEGIYIEQGKTGVKQIKEWTPRLRDAVDVALSVQKVSSLKYLFCDERGNRPKQTTMASWYSKARKLAKEKYEASHKEEWKTDFTFHDIKAKSMSDYEGGDLRHFSGHKTEAQAQSYNRKIKVTSTLKNNKPV